MFARGISNTANALLIINTLTGQNLTNIDTSLYKKIIYIFNFNKNTYYNFANTSNNFFTNSLKYHKRHSICTI